MAKDLPYFKFFCSEWNDGDITLEDFEIQGLFINVCSYYWSNECDINVDKLYKKFKHNSHDIDYLIDEGLIKLVDGFININFLDEQSAERKTTSKKNSDAGKASAEKRRLAKLDSNEKSTPVEIPLNEKSTIKIREEEIREEKNKGFISFWTKYPKKVQKSDCKKKFLKLKQSEIDIILNTIDDFIAYKPFRDYTHPNPMTYLNQKRWTDELGETTKTEFNKFKRLHLTQIGTIRSQCREKPLLDILLKRHDCTAEEIHEYILFREANNYLNTYEV